MATKLTTVRDEFGTLISEVADVVYHRSYRNTGERFVLCTTSHGIRGDQDPAFIDIALSKEDAKIIYDKLGKYFEKQE